MALFLALAVGSLRRLRGAELPRNDERFSQNALFRCDIADDAHPRGEPTARRLAERLPARGWLTSPPEDWRNAGWEVRCRREQRDMTVIVTALEADQWFAQVGPADARGVAAGAPDQATRADCYDLAAATHEILQSLAATNLQWCWDGYPEAPTATQAPARWISKD